MKRRAQAAPRDGLRKASRDRASVASRIPGIGRGQLVLDLDAPHGTYLIDKVADEMDAARDKFPLLAALAEHRRSCRIAVNVAAGIAADHARQALIEDPASFDEAKAFDAQLKKIRQAIREIERLRPSDEIARHYVDPSLPFNEVKYEYLTADRELSQLRKRMSDLAAEMDAFRSGFPLHGAVGGARNALLFAFASSLGAAWSVMTGGIGPPRSRRSAFVRFCFAAWRDAKMPAMVDRNGKVIAAEGDQHEAFGQKIYEILTMNG